MVVLVISESVNSMHSLSASLWRAHYRSRVARCLRSRLVISVRRRAGLTGLCKMGSPLSSASRSRSGPVSLVAGTKRSISPDFRVQTRLWSHCPSLLALLVYTPVHAARVAGKQPQPGSHGSISSSSHREHAPGMITSHPAWWGGGTARRQGMTSDHSQLQSTGGTTPSTG